MDHTLIIEPCPGKLDNTTGCINHHLVFLIDGITASTFALTIDRGLYFTFHMNADVYASVHEL